MIRSICFCLILLIPACQTEPNASHNALIDACDQQTAYVNDDDRVAEPVTRDEIDIPSAIEACRAAILVDPDNGRLHYQLARVLGYNGERTDARVHREIAAERSYPAALFVLGIVDAFNAEGDPETVCRGARYMERATETGAFVALSAYPAYRAEGMFEHCEGLVSRDDLLKMLDRAEPLANGYYRSMLVRAARIALADS